MTYKIISSLVNQSIKLTNRIRELQRDYEFYNDLFTQSSCHEHGSYCDCVYANFMKGEQISDTIALLKHYRQELSDTYDELKNKTYSNGIYYAITIGSAEKNDTNPCSTLWHRFKDSADAKDFLTQEAYFERGENGYVHIHAIVQKSKGWSMSIKKLQSRYGKYKEKQHNFDIKRLKGLDITKWTNYIKKDAGLPWNTIVNECLL
ncbi:MAG: putative replicase [Circoviridae sp.]|nr:MAG: putative replicase [Circoviridae sp.]